MRKQSTIFGNPQRIINNRGTALTVNEFEDYCKSEGIQHLLIATRVPRGNGQAERINRIIVPRNPVISINMLKEFSKS